MRGFGGRGKIKAKLPFCFVGAYGAKRERERERERERARERARFQLGS